MAKAKTPRASNVTKNQVITMPEVAPCLWFARRRL